ncbi:MAG: YceI family protein [Gammaproteobacteria bacterium]
MKRCILLACYVLLSPSLAAAPWSSIQNSQAIQFIATYDDVAFNGVFKRFNSTILIDPLDIENSYIHSNIDIASVDTNSRDRDQALVEPEWFFTSNFPQATFRSTDISLIDSNQYSITGTLKIRDQEKSITFPLEWHIIDENRAHAKAQFKLDRRDFNIGTGEWAKDKTIGFRVDVNISINYQRH